MKLQNYVIKTQWIMKDVTIVSYCKEKYHSKDNIRLARLAEGCLRRGGSTRSDFDSDCRNSCLSQAQVFVMEAARLYDSSKEKNEKAAH